MPELPLTSDPTASRPEQGLDDASVLARFAASAGDAPGLLAFALHRRALVDFQTDFARRHGRPPDAGEARVFMVGELAEGRIAAYRLSAETLLAARGGQTAAAPAAAAARMSKPVRPRWPWMGLWITAPIPSAEGPINWRGLFSRLFVLLLAVVATALLLRVLIVKS